MARQAPRMPRSLKAKSPPPVTCALSAIVATNHTAIRHRCERSDAADLFDAAKIKRLALAEVTLGANPNPKGNQYLVRACAWPMPNEITLTVTALSHLECGCAEFQ